LSVPTASSFKEPAAGGSDAAEILWPWPRHQEQKNIEIAKQLAEALGGEIAASVPFAIPMAFASIGSSGQTVAPKL